MATIITAHMTTRSSISTGVQVCARGMAISMLIAPSISTAR